MSLKQEIAKHLEEKRVGKQGFQDTQNKYNSSISRLQDTAQELRKSGNISFNNFSYGPEGSSQQMWETSVTTDKGVFHKSNINNNGREYQIYDMLFNNGEYAQVYVEKGEIVELIVKDSNDIFRKVNISELPLNGCELKSQDVVQIIDDLKNYAQFSSKDNTIEENQI